MKEVFKDELRTVYEGLGYKVSFERMFPDLPMKIKIENIGINKIRRPSFICDDEGNLLLSYSNMVDIVSDEEDFEWISETKDFIRKFKEIYKKQSI